MRKIFLSAAFFMAGADIVFSLALHDASFLLWGLVNLTAGMFQLSSYEYKSEEEKKP